MNDTPSHTEDYSNLTEIAERFAPNDQPKR